MRQLTIQVIGNDEDQEQLMVNELTDMFVDVDDYCQIDYARDLVTVDLRTVKDRRK